MTSQPFRRQVVIVGSADPTDDIRSEEPFVGFVNKYISELYLPWCQYSLIIYYEGCMNNDLVLVNCLTWTNSGTTFIISTPNVQMFAELLGSLTWVLFAACSLEYYIFVMLCPYHLALVLMLFAFHNVSSWASCVSWRCTASKSSVGWVCRHLLPLNVYQHLFCVPLQSEPNLGILPPQANTWPRDLQSSGKLLNLL